MSRLGRFCQGVYEGAVGATGFGEAEARRAAAGALLGVLGSGARASDAARRGEEAMRAAMRVGVDEAGRWDAFAAAVRDEADDVERRGRAKAEAAAVASAPWWRRLAGWLRGDD